MAGNDNVHASRSGKTDEFYTQLFFVIVMTHTKAIFSNTLQ